MYKKRGCKKEINYLFLREKVRFSFLTWWIWYFKKSKFREIFESREGREYLQQSPPICSFTFCNFSYPYRFVIFLPKMPNLSLIIKHYTRPNCETFYRNYSSVLIKSVKVMKKQDWGTVTGLVVLFCLFGGGKFKNLIAIWEHLSNKCKGKEKYGSTDPFWQI